MIGYILISCVTYFVGFIFALEASFRGKRKENITDAWLGNFVSRLLFVAANTPIVWILCEQFKQAALPWILLSMLCGNREFMGLYNLLNAPTVPPEQPSET